jgi:beta-glucosidase
MAVLAGVDMSKVPYDYSFYDICVNLTKKDPQFAARVDDATMRILKVKEKVGLFDNRYAASGDLDKIGTKETHDFNLEAARESVILAKNDNNTLPLQANKKILVTGASGNLLRVIHGGWSYMWQGNNETNFETFGRKKFTIYEAVKAYASGTTYVQGADYSNLTNIDDAVKAAQQADVIVLCIGEDTYAETPGNINSLMLMDSQLQLAEQILELNKPTVLVYLGGRPRIMTKAAQKANAVLLAFLPGKIRL